MINENIHQYKILSKLGEGGMGIVYEARDTRLDRIVALKFLPQYLSSDSNEKERFYHEARAAASLNHQNIAVVYEINEYENKIFIAMEYLDGNTLKHVVEYQGESLTIKKVLEIAVQICEGLAAAHEKGIVHRDIKSDNIMLTPRGQVKIMDFGLAKLKGASRLTQAGSTVGTAAYMSPEQAQGEDVDQRSDIFSFGVVLYELLTAHLPFRGEHQAALVYSVVNENPQPIARFNDKVSPELDRIVHKALAKDKDERYQHVDDMLADLRREKKNIEYAKSGYYKVSDKSIKVPVEEGEKSKKLLKIIIPAAVIVLLGVLFLFFNPFKSFTNADQVSPGPINSLAVMYFENIPDPADKEHSSEMLTSLLITSLSQIKGLEVISRERLLNIQNDLGQTDNKSISSTIAEQVAQRAGVSTMLVGSILQEKPTLAVTTRLIDVKSGRIISSQRVTNFSADKIFNLVDSLSILINDDLRTTSSINEIKSVSEVTTKSPEAYRAYAAGLELFYKIYAAEAIAAFSKAIEIDKNFAMAYFALSQVQYFVGDNEIAQGSLQKAVELADRTTSREKLQILTYSYAQRGEPLKAIEGYEELIDKYPHELNSYLQLGYYLYDRNLIEPEKGLEVLQRGLKIEPSAKSLMNLLAYTFAYLNRRQEAYDAVNEYINLVPAEPNPYDSQGDIFAWFEEYDSSLVSYKKAMSLRSDFSSANKIGAYYLLRDNYEAADLYSKSGDFEAASAEVHRGLIQSAIKKLQGIPESQTGEEYRLRMIINFCYGSGQYDKMLRYCIQYSDKLHKNPADFIFGRDYLAWGLVKNGKTTEAENIVNSLEKSVNKTSTLLRIQAEYAAALVYFESGKYQQALESFRIIENSLPQIMSLTFFTG